MKAIIAFTILFFSAVAFGGRLYNEKDDIIQEVTKKYDGVLSFSDRVIQEIENENGKNEDGAREEAKNLGTQKHDDTKVKFEKDIIETTRSAIARGKPLSAIECIAKVTIEGRQLLATTLEDYIKAVDAVKEKRVQELIVEKLHVELIKKATEGLKEESLKKMNDEKNINNVKTLKNDAIKKANTAYKSLQDIEARIMKPMLKERYKNLRNANEIKYNELKDSLLKRLQRCIVRWPGLENRFDYVKNVEFKRKVPIEDD